MCTIRNIKDNSSGRRKNDMMWKYGNTQMNYALGMALYGNIYKIFIILLKYLEQIIV